MLRIVLLVLALSVVGGCSVFHTRSASTGPYLQAKLCGFRLDGRTHEARFSIDLTVGRPLPKGGIVESTFQNPLDPMHPLQATQVVQGDEKELRIVSPPVKGIERKEYAMTVKLYDPADRTKPLATLTENCLSPFAAGEFGTEYR